MNVSLYTQTPNSLSFLKSPAIPGCGFKRFQDDTEESPVQSKKMRDLLRSLTREPSSEPTASSASKEKDEGKIKPPSHYNFKEVEMKILRAKNALSAGQAFLSAKRKVLEIRRKLAVGKEDPEELQTDLTHAKRMELAARKKKHHLELEELVENTRKLDEKRDTQEEAVTDLKNSVIEAKEEEVSKKEDEIFETRNEMAEESSARTESAAFSEEELAKINEMISEFGEEELKELEEAMESLEEMEVMDPHMSKEELDELKRKHRAAEQKAIMKADMDYLKDTIKHQVEKGSVSLSAVFGTSQSSLAAISVSAVSISGSASVDIQV